MMRSEKRFYVYPSFQEDDPFVKEFVRRARKAKKTPTTLARDILLAWVEGEHYEYVESEAPVATLNISALAEQIAQELLNHLPTLCLAEEGEAKLIPATPTQTQKVEELLFDEDAALENVDLFNLGGF